MLLVLLLILAVLLFAVFIPLGLFVAKLFFIGLLAAFLALLLAGLARSMA